MKISEHFEDSDFLSKETIKRIKRKGQPTTRYINMHLVEAAEFTRAFLNNYLCNLSDEIVGVYMILNKGELQTRGTRKPWDNSSSGPFSSHWWGFAFDCDVMLKIKGGDRVEINYHELYDIIIENQDKFLEAGITTIEHPDLATTWLHLAIDWRPGITEMEIIGDGK